MADLRSPCVLCAISRQTSTAASDSSAGIGGVEKRLIWDEDEVVLHLHRAYWKSGWGLHDAQLRSQKRDMTYAAYNYNDYLARFRDLSRMRNNLSFSMSGINIQVRVYVPLLTCDCFSSHSPHSLHSGCHQLNSDESARWPACSTRGEGCRSKLRSTHPCFGSCCRTGRMQGSILW